MDLPKRKPNRLKNYDYSQGGAYFITFCTKDRHEMLWNVGATFGRPQESLQLSEYGTIIKNEIDHIGKIYDYFVAGERRTTKGRPYSITHYATVQRCSDKTNRVFIVAKTISRPYHPKRTGISKDM